MIFIQWIFLTGMLLSPPPDAAALHKKAVVVDTHNDVLLRSMRGENIAVRTSEGHSDMVRLIEGGVDVQIFSVWCGTEYGHGTAYRRANAMIDTLYATVQRCTSTVAMARTYSDLQKILKLGKMAALIGVEGGHMIEDSLQYLEALAARGMNYLTLTWNNSTSWATSAADETEKGDSLAFQGLTEFGKKIVRRMNELGVIVDLSHAGENTFWDVMKTTSKPVLVSHSSVYALCPSRRNLKDDQLRALAKNGGVVCINFYSGFIDSTYERKTSSIRRMNKVLVDSIKGLYTDHWKREMAVDSVLAPLYQSVRPPLSVLIDHIDYVARLVGPEYVGIGSDFDGVESLPAEMDDVTFLPNITKELLKRGYRPADVEKILGGNVMRVLQANMK